MRINNKTVSYILCCFPFFELFTLEMLIARGVLTGVLSLITAGFSVARLLISLYMIARVFARNLCSITYTAWGIIAFSFFRVISSLINGTFGMGLVLAAISYIGFVMVCEWMIYESKQDFYKAVFLLFGIYAIVGAISIFAFPNGFFDAATKAQAVYFLGSKNSSFDYFLIFMLLLVIRSFEQTDNLPRFTEIIVLFFLIAEVICDSSNAMLCLAILMCMLFMVKYTKNIYSCCSPAILVTAVFILGFMIVFGSTSNLLRSVVAIIGRDLSFSGRDTLWKQALEVVARNPLAGAGVNSSFVLATGAKASHAHCFYLDVFAKYGVFCFGAIMAMITGVMKKISNVKRDKRIVTIGAFVFVYLLHCVTEDASIYILGMILLLAETADMKENVVYRK